MKKRAPRLLPLWSPDAANSTMKRKKRYIHTPPPPTNNQQTTTTTKRWSWFAKNFGNSTIKPTEQTNLADDWLGMLWSSASFNILKFRRWLSCSKPSIRKVTDGYSYSGCCISVADGLYQLMLVVPTNERRGLICGPQPDVQWRSILDVVGDWGISNHPACRDGPAKRRFPLKLSGQGARRKSWNDNCDHPALPSNRSQWLL